MTFRSSMVCLAALLFGAQGAMAQIVLGAGNGRARRGAADGAFDFPHPAPQQPRIARAAGRGTILP